MSTPTQIMQEIREKTQVLLDGGKTTLEARESVLEMIQASHDMAYMTCFIEILLSPEAGLGFASAMEDSVKFTNEVLWSEFKIVPLHLSEITSPVFKTIEEVFQMDLEEALELYREGGLDLE
jgi:hypothetical protein